MELVSRCTALLNAGDWQSLGALLDEDVEFRDLGHAPDQPETYRGREAARVAAAGWTEVYADWGSEIIECVDRDPWILCDTRWHGRGKGSDIPIDLRVVNAYEIKGGKIARAILTCPDMATALRTAGLSG